MSGYRLEFGTLPNCTGTDWNSKQIGIHKMQERFQSVQGQFEIPNGLWDGLEL